MPKAITDTLGRLTHALREFTVAQRTIAIIGVAVLLIGAIALGAWFTRSTYSPLFSGLSGPDASAIVDQLEADGVSYQLTDGGATIMVPDSAVNGQRLKAAAAGLPSLDSGGYALLDSMGVTASEFQQSVTYKRAIEGELAAAIESIDGVSTASVRLAIPEESVFVSEQVDPTASVFVDTKSGSSLGTEQVEAITHLTAASVDGLTPENVSVVSADGTVLSAVGVGATGGVDKQATTYEARVRGAIQGMLDQVVGVGNSTVAVAADINLRSGQRVEESFATPEGAPVLSEQTENQEYTGTGGSTGGVLGPDNIAVPTGGGGDGSYNSDSATRTNGIDKVTETTSIPAGEIERQAVSVAVNSDVVTGMSAATLEGLVAGAAGIDTVRGDSVTVELVSFTKPDATAAAAALEAARAQDLQNNITQIITVAIPIAGLIVLLTIVLISLRRARKRRLAPVDGGEFTQLHDETLAAQALLGGVDPAALPPGSGDPMGGLDVVDSDEAQVAVDRMRLDIDNLAAANPQRAADHLRNLMDDRSSV
jgi:flagellar M-ring protein FliF